MVDLTNNPLTITSLNTYIPALRARGVVVTWDYDASGSAPCFIATAAYGTPMAGDIQTLRQFRDKYLLPNPAGRHVVKSYYTISPPIAEFITEHPGLKPVVRLGLVLPVAMSAVAVNATPIQTIVILSLMMLASVTLAIWVRRRQGRGPEHTRR